MDIKNRTRTFTDEEQNALANVVHEWSRQIISMITKDCAIDSELSQICVKYKDNMIVSDAAFAAVGTALGMFLCEMILSKGITIKDAERHLLLSALIGTQQGLNVALEINKMSNVIDITKHLNTKN